MANTADFKQHPTDEWIGSLRARYPTERYVDEALTKKLSGRAGPRHSVATADNVTRLLRDFLARRISQPFEISDVRALTGGSSKEQFSFQLERQRQDGQFQRERLVLRLQPSESIVETHRLREFDVMKALKGTLPVPEVHWVDAEGAEFGRPALISAFCEGVARPPKEGLVTGPTGGYGPRYRALLAPQFVQHLATLGTFDWTKTHLPSFDVPKVGTNEAVLWAINWWHRVWEEDSLEPVPMMTAVAHWLREHAPPVDHISLVHADYKGGNFLFRPESGEMTAVLDWELAHLGDRHEDLAMLLDPLYGERDEDGSFLAAGLLPPETLLSEYARLSGLPVDPERIRYYQVFTSWRSAVISASTASRCAAGEKTHADILLAWVASCCWPIMGSMQKLLTTRTGGRPQ
jgi:aminoglycoside phosphotransferase (APT) family kinase protein